MHAGEAATRRQTSPQGFTFEIDARSLRFTQLGAAVVNLGLGPADAWLAASRHVSELAAKAGRSAVTAAFVDAGTGDGQVDIEFRVEPNPEGIRWLRVVASVCETPAHPVFRGIAVDTSLQRELESSFVQMRERYALTTSAANVGVWDWDLVSGDFYLDPNIKRLLGYADHEIPNDIEVWTEYVHPSDREAVMQAATAHMEGRTPEYLFEHRMLHRDGSVRWILVRGQVVRDDDGKPIRFVGTDADITERKQLEQRLDEQRRLEETRAGHDLHDGVGQELTGIALLMKSLETRMAAEDSPHLDTLRGIDAALSQAIATTRNLARGLHPGLDSELGLQGALSSLCERVAKLYRVECRFDCTCPFPILEEVRANHLYRIAQEALTNSVKHGEAKHIELRCGHREDAFEMDIVDDGNGFPDTPTEGGMGLHIMQYRIRTIGGTLEVSPEPGGGSRVHCCCPLPSVDASI